MANVSNQGKIDFAIPTSGILSVPGFNSEFSGADWDRLESRFVSPDASEWQQRQVRGKEYLYCDAHSGGIILRPNLEPVDMDGELVSGVYKGTDYLCSGGDWTKQKAFGYPDRYVDYQRQVQVLSGSAYVGTSWWIHSGDKIGKTGQGLPWKENQGFVCWIASNMLPANEKSQIVFHLIVLDHLGQAENGIYVRIVDGKEVLMAHYYPVSDNNKIPPVRDVQVQWQQYTLSGQRELYRWSGDPKVYALWIIGRYILLSLNGLESPVSMRCGNYGIGTDTNGKPYPVVLKEGASLWIQGKGQAQIGFKRMVYAAEGEVETPLVFPGYSLNNPYAAMHKARVFTDTAVRTKGLFGGSSKAGGVYQLGPLKQSAADDGVYTIAVLSATPLNPSLPPLTEAEWNALTTAQQEARLKVEYYHDVAETSPVLYRFGVYDARVRATAGGSPLPSITANIGRYTETMSSGADCVYQGGSCDLEIYTKGSEYPTVLAAKMPTGRVSITPRGLVTAQQRGTFIFDPSLSVPSANDVHLQMKGRDVVSRLQEMPVDVSVSYDDLGYTDIDVLEGLGLLAGVTVQYPVGAKASAKQLPVGEDESKPLWQFQPASKVWEAMEKIRKLTGWLLYPQADGTLMYRPVPDVTAAPDYVLGRSASLPIVDIGYRSLPIWKTRIYVQGRAGTNTDNYKAGDKLVGAWLRPTLESSIGYSIPWTEVDDTLADWDAIEARGTELDRQFNGNNAMLSFRFSDATPYLDMWLYDVIQWTDPLHTLVDGKKFLVTSLSYDVNAFDCTANVEAKLIN